MKLTEREENRLIRRLRKAMELYIARGTEPMDWMHYSYDGCNQKLSAWPQARTPERLEELERCLRRHLPSSRAVYLGCTMVLDEQHRKKTDIIKVVKKMAGAAQIEEGETK